MSRVLSEVADWVYQNAGIDVPIDELKVEVYTNKAGVTGGQARVYFRNPLPHARNSPGRIKVDLTTHEILVREPVRRAVLHPYTDCPAEGIHALCYDFPEIFAEKTRALAERTRPRDLYDVINLYRRPETQTAREDIRVVLAEKCAFKKINVPKLADLLPYRDDVAATWVQMLDHQLPQLLSFESFWDELPDFFNWLEVRLEIPATAPVRTSAGEVPIFASQPLPRGAMAPVGIMGRIRFAAANRLLVDLDYETLAGRRSRRLIEPYSLRQSAEGNILLYASRDDSGEPRAYRVDHIHGATVTDRNFVPRYTIELTMAGPSDGSAPRTRERRTRAHPWLFGAQTRQPPIDWQKTSKASAEYRPNVRVRMFLLLQEIQAQKAELPTEQAQGQIRMGLPRSNRLASRHGLLAVSSARANATAY